jgi:hypothetical protein
VLPRLSSRARERSRLSREIRRPASGTPLAACDHGAAATDKRVDVLQRADAYTHATTSAECSA